MLYSKKVLAVVVASLLSGCSSTRPEVPPMEAPQSGAITPLTADRPLVALVLGSGGARGFAHVGVIKALEEAGIRPDIVAGTSAGAVVAALYAAGYTAAQLEAIAVNIEKENLLDLTPFGHGWVRGEALQGFINRAVGNRPIEKLNMPFAAVATEAKSGRMVVFNRGDTGLAVRASSSIPDVFIPPIINGQEYVDGGITDPVPSGVARSMGADIIIAVDIMLQEDTLLTGGRHLRDADIVIKPLTHGTQVFDFEGKLLNIAAGAEAARHALPQIREFVLRIADYKKAGSRKVTHVASR
jgi:NTE family protein